MSVKIVKGVGYLYKIVNTVNGKVYVGQAVDYERRWQEHRTALNNGTHYNAHLQRAWHTYGADSFTFELLDFSGRERLNNEEIMFIATHKSHDPQFGYNKTLGGGGVIPTQETRAKISEALKGKQVSKETKAKMAVSSSVLTPTQVAEVYRDTAHTNKHLADVYGVDLTCINKIRRGITGTHITAQINAEGFFHPAHLDVINGTQSNKPKPVAQIDKITGAVIRVWANAYEAQREGGFTNSNISKCCSGKLKTHGGYKWQFYMETQAGA